MSVTCPPFPMMNAVPDFSAGAFATLLGGKDIKDLLRFCQTYSNPLTDILDAFMLAVSQGDEEGIRFLVPLSFKYWEEVFSTCDNFIVERDIKEIAELWETFSSQEGYEQIAE